MHRAEIRPLFGDVDAMNVVYYANYLRFFERGRCELMRSEGLPYRIIEESGLSLPVTEAGVRYRSPARYDELLVVETRVAWVKKASLQFDYRVIKPNGDGQEQELVSGFTRHGCVRHDGRIAPLPAQALEALRRHLE